MKMGDETLQAKDLAGSITVMRKFNARRRLKAAADAVILANRMNRLMGKFAGLGDTSESSSKKSKSFLFCENVVHEPSLTLLFVVYRRRGRRKQCRQQRAKSWQHGPIRRLEAIDGLRHYGRYQLSCNRPAQR
jgi:hypothetical protein